MAHEETRSLIEWCHYGHDLARGSAEPEMSDKERRYRVFYIAGVIHAKLHLLGGALLLDEQLYDLVDRTRHIETYLRTERFMTRQGRPETSSEEDKSMIIASLRFSVAASIFERLMLEPTLRMLEEAADILYSPVTIKWSDGSPEIADAGVL